MAADRDCWVAAAPAGPSFTCAGVPPPPVWSVRQACTQCSGRVGDVLKRMGFGYQPFKTVEDYFQYTMVRLYRGDDEPLQRQTARRSTDRAAYLATDLPPLYMWWSVVATYMACDVATDPPPSYM